MSLYKLSGYVSLALGILACVLLINPFLLFFSLLSAIIGFGFATVNVFQNAKYEYARYGMGYISMLLCSVPVIFLLVLIFRH
ncbi:MAG: hypothetical protein JST26_00115 [Bacteroidetes bacterium]|nr:hypothetical protein [Bacteroidota bacterium]